MADEQNKQKQGGDMDTADTAREGFSADELGQASIYDDPTMIAQQMRRGDESKGDPDARDTAGATAVPDTPRGRADQDTVPSRKGEASR